MTALRRPVDRRIRVIIVRRRLEDLAATLVERATGQRPQRHRMVAHRLKLLAAHVPIEKWASAYGLACRAANTYAQTSSVLHSNRAFGDVPEVLVQEWERVVTEVTIAMEDHPSSSASASAVNQRGVVITLPNDQVRMGYYGS